ncbi:MAG TPA: hypothetical protein VF183_05320 [Acidimicrobiales bacterium]
MSRRIDIELTSSRPDGTWTWRAAGAKQPKGEIDGALLPAGAKVGDVLRAEAESFLDGLVITSIITPKESRREPERLEVLGSRRGDEQLVTASLVDRRGRARARGERRERAERRGARPEARRADGERAPSRPRGDATGRERAARRETAARPAPPPAPKPVRLRPGRAHRNAVLAELPEEQKPIAEQLLRGGIPAVRQALEKQNAAARAEGLPEVKADALLALAEKLLPRLRAAEWRDKADAALAGVNEIDLRDLRTVVVAADAAARDEASRALAQQLRDALARRVEEEHQAWLNELAELVRDGRTVRALRLSSRPPKAGAPLPPELSEQLAAAASAALTSDISQDRWATLVDAVALSPVRLTVKPAGIPAKPSEELIATVTRVGSRVPQIAELFGVTPAPVASPPRRAPGRGRGARAAATPSGTPSSPASGGESQTDAAGTAEHPEPEAAAAPPADAPETDDAPENADAEAADGTDVPPAS